MASVVAASQAIVSVPSSFSGLRAASSSEAAARAPVVSVSSSPALSRPLAVARASLPEAASKSVKSVLSIAAGAALAASLAMSVPAMAADVVMGLDDGSLKFSPEVVELKAGEKINFINNAGFPHNVIFDEDEVPEGVNATAISMSEEDLLNSKGETFSVVLTTPGKYSFYCSPHQGAGMKGTAIVN